MFCFAQKVASRIGYISKEIDFPYEIPKKMKSYLEKELGKKDKPKEICKVLKSLCLNSVKTMKSKIYLKKNCTI